MNHKKSAKVIVVSNLTGYEGRNKVILKVLGGVESATTTETGQSGYRQRDNMEHERYDEARSIFHGEQNNQNGVNLFERNLSRGYAILFIFKLSEIKE